MKIRKLNIKGIILSAALGNLMPRKWEKGYIKLGNANTSILYPFLSKGNALDIKKAISEKRKELKAKKEDMALLEGWGFMFLRARMQEFVDNSTDETVRKSQYEGTTNSLSILVGNFYRDVADISDYRKYFCILHESGLASDQEIESIFNDAGFNGLEDYFEQRQSYVENFSIFDVNWDDKKRFDKNVRDKIIALYHRTPLLKIQYPFSKSLDIF